MAAILSTAGSWAILGLLIGLIIGCVASAGALVVELRELKETRKLHREADDYLQKAKAYSEAANAHRDAALKWAASADACNRLANERWASIQRYERLLAGVDEPKERTH